MWLAVLLSTVGLALLSLNGVSVDPGVWLTLASAVMYALHIVWLGQWSRQRGGLRHVGACRWWRSRWSACWPRCRTVRCCRRIAAAWFAVLYMALVAGAGAMLMQTWAQSHLPATRAAIVMTTEPVFAAAFAVALGSDVLSWRMLLGGGLMLAAMYLVELMPRRKGVVAPTCR